MVEISHQLVLVQKAGKFVHPNNSARIAYPFTVLASGMVPDHPKLATTYPLRIAIETLFVSIHSLVGSSLGEATMAKTDMERIGLFSEPGYTTISDKYTSRYYSKLQRFC